MRSRFVLWSLAILVLAQPVPLLAQNPDTRPRAQGQGGRDAARAARPRAENLLYLRGQRAMDNGRWEEAARLFARLASLNGSRSDAALYWLAYAENRLGRRDDALRTIAELQKTHPDSRYTTQGNALEMEVRRDAGQPVRPEVASDDELKLIALQALQRSDPERAAPMLEGILRGTAAPRLKTRALFLLARSDAPQARRVVADVARGTASPELQERAIGYLGARQTAETRALLSEIYASTKDIRVKRRVLRALTVSGDAESMVALARTETNPSLQREMVEKLSLMRNKVALDYLAGIAR